MPAPKSSSEATTVIAESDPDSTDTNTSTAADDAVNVAVDAAPTARLNRRAQCGDCSSPLISDGQSAARMPERDTLPGVSVPRPVMQPAPSGTTVGGPKTVREHRPAPAAS